jgi:hypothetical protein
VGSAAAVASNAAHCLASAAVWSDADDSVNTLRRGEALRTRKKKKDVSGSDSREGVGDVKQGINAEA